jgi:hypothetical protein
MLRAAAGVLCVLLSIVPAQTRSQQQLRVGVILGADNHTENTSDQEQWCVEQAKADVDAMLKGSNSPFSLDLDLVYAGADSESAHALQVVTQYLQHCAEAGIGIVVAAYLSDVVRLPRNL